MKRVLHTTQAAPCMRRAEGPRNASEQRQTIQRVGKRGRRGLLYAAGVMALPVLLIFAAKQWGPDPSARRDTSSQPRQEMKCAPERTEEARKREWAEYFVNRAILEARISQVGRTIMEMEAHKEDPVGNAKGD